MGPSNDSDGTARYACLYEPKTASSKNPLPLVIYIHPSLTDADSISLTGLLKVLSSANLSDDPKKPGFIMLAPEGRNTTHFYPGTDAKGLGWDNWYRQLTPSGDVPPFKENVDAATIDHFVAQETLTQKVDSNRIFITGWSNGAAMAYLYGLSRPNIAAVAAYSAPNPFGAFSDPCPQTPVTSLPTDDSQIQIYNPDLPISQIHNDCDISGICPNCEAMETALLVIGVSVQDTIINGPQAQANGCDITCGTNPNGDPNNSKGNTTGVKNHIRWPTMWNIEILDFFRRHPLNDRKS